MRSSRLPADLSPNDVSRTVEALSAAGVELADLTESNPTRAGIHYPDELLRGLSDARSLRYEPSALGLLPAREAVAGDFARRQVDVSPSRVALTASTSEAYGLLFKLLCDPGDEVLVPRPSYPLFEHLTRLESVCAVPYELEYHGTWRIDLDSVRLRLSPRTRAVLVVSPNNPTGSFLHEDDLQALAGICSARGMALIGDEVFADYPLEHPGNPPSVLSHATPALTISLGGLSKSAGLPQVKLGWMAFGGDAAVVTDTMAAYEIVADTYLSVSTPVQVAAPGLIEAGAAARRQIQGRVSRNLAALDGMLPAFPAVSRLRVEGGWSAVLQVPALRSEEQLVLDLLRHDHVLVHPGFFFDFPREAFLVPSLLVRPDVFDAAVPVMLARASSAEAHA